MEHHDLEIGTRITVRYTAEDGPHEVIGHIQSISADEVRLRDRRDQDHDLSWSQIQAWRVVPPAPPRRRRPPRE